MGDEVQEQSGELRNSPDPSAEADQEPESTGDDDGNSISFDSGSHQSLQTGESGPQLTKPYHYPPLTGAQGLPTFSDIVTTHRKISPITIELPVEGSPDGGYKITISLPKQWAFRNLQDRPSYFEVEGSPLHDARYIIPLSPGFVDVSSITAVTDPATGVNYTLRVVTDERESTPSGTRYIAVDGSDRSCLLTVSEFQALLTNTTSGLVPPEKDGKNLFYKPKGAVQEYMHRLHNDPPWDSLEDKVSDGGLTGELTTNRGTSVDLAKLELVTNTTTPAVPTYHVDLICRSSGVSTTQSELAHFQDQVVLRPAPDQTPIEPKTPHTRPATKPPTPQRRTLPLPIFLDMLVADQFVPPETVSTEEEE